MMRSSFLNLFSEMDVWKAVLCCILLPPIGVAAVSVGVLTWAQTPLACGLATAFALWVFVEVRAKEKEREEMKTLRRAASYFFEVAKHLEEVQIGCDVVCSNDEFELVLRKRGSV